VVAASLPCVDLYHLLLLDIPSSVSEIAAGNPSEAITPRGKPGPTAPRGLRHGVNDYTALRGLKSASPAEVTVKI